jgi:hypothetical protein
MVDGLWGYINPNQKEDEKERRVFKRGKSW